MAEPASDFLRAIKNMKHLRLKQALDTLEALQHFNSKNDVDTKEMILKELADHPNAKVRTALAKNLNLPPVVQEILAEDKDPDIRYYLAKNPTITPDTHQKLKNDTVQFVRDAANQNTSFNTHSQFNHR